MDLTDLVIIRDVDLGPDLTVDNYDAIILTGSDKRVSEREYEEELIKLAQETDRPLLGICYGHQLLCKALGCEVSTLGRAIRGLFDVEILNQDEIFLGMEHKVKFRKFHRDSVVYDAARFSWARLARLARSIDCEVEAVKHEKRPLYGVQFHPETSGKNGRKVALNFYQRVVMR